jgi:Bacterial PH domain
MSDHDSAIREWSPAPGLVAVTWVASLLSALWLAALWISGSDPPGRLIAGAACVGLTALALFWTRARPRLHADAGGVTIGGLRRPRHHPWPLVTDVRVVRVRRLGRESSLLEIDTVTADGGERLYVLGRLDLGADPEDVAAALARTRPA